MKAIYSLAVLALLGISGPALAQTTEEKKDSKPKKVYKDSKKAVKKSADKTAEWATKGKAKATDKKSDVWVGPEGQTIYIDDGNKYYWVNGKGKRIYVSESSLKKRVN